MSFSREVRLFQILQTVNKAYPIMCPGVGFLICLFFLRCLLSEGISSGFVTPGCV